MLKTSTLQTPQVKNKDYKTWPGKPYPLGATYDEKGVNFALFSENATAVYLCLFHSSADKEEHACIQIREQTDHVWHIYIPDMKPGQLYGFRVDGPHDPAQGMRFNPNKLLIDPYAKAINGKIEWSSAIFGYPLSLEAEDRDLVQDTEDSAAGMNKSVVIDSKFDWEDVEKPNIPLHETIIYEVHVKGFTAQHPGIDPELRGTYKGMAQPQVIEYFKKLGITAVELLPVHHFVNDSVLVDKGLSNYWGYNSIGFFAPYSEYSSAGSLGEQIIEFKEMVKAYHKAGIEVILDVVYNHTAEGNHYGPTLCFKGIDNTAYYRLVEGNRRYYMDYTGTGNSLNMLHARSLQLVMDSLRYWVTEMQVDGFRFDLASTLARGLLEVGKLSTFLDTIHQDPIVSQVKLIAEPWDIGEGGYQVGNFPVQWGEWNGKYRDSVRRFWKGDESQVSELANRLSGSSDLYEATGRKPTASINFITAHDGFTLHDLVSYNEKHNEANKEDNRDGETHNESWNCGIEGLTADPEIIELRERQKRNFMATLIFSQGIPMISMGDEYGRTQHGNNNVYCQDNEISWFDWEWDERQQAFYEFTRTLMSIRTASPIMRRRRFFLGRSVHGSGVKDIRWLRTDGKDMTNKDWSSSYVRCLGMQLNGKAMEEYDEQGRRITDGIYLLLVNSYWEDVPFTFPKRLRNAHWEVLVDTYKPERMLEDELVSEELVLHSRSLLLLKKKDLRRKKK
ncbi:glycogen debranching protein GlgX [Catalinimonas niigatensis]|uniref:glycogen debranching protein GlgX n=1 Tax=Catalinimonas niigatensis TaxID=1397264 RepID=UPI002665B869|nr:glycogen debranching protein GlgX [Catalinimonas niigatensis]WPP49937.1 glycogen debranching protein GlgX [Catalinimonas niigatensis]